MHYAFTLNSLVSHVAKNIITTPISSVADADLHPSLPEEVPSGFTCGARLISFTEEQWTALYAVGSCQATIDNALSAAKHSVVGGHVYAHARKLISNHFYIFQDIDIYSIIIYYITQKSVKFKNTVLYIIYFKNNSLLNITHHTSHSIFFFLIHFILFLFNNQFTITNFMQRVGIHNK